MEVAAGAAYVIDPTAHALLSNYSDYEALLIAIVAVPSTIGEGWFGLWLLLRGGRHDHRHGASSPPGART